MAKSEKYEPLKFKPNEDLRAFFKDDGLRSDRAGAIVACAYLEDALTRAILSKLKNDDLVSDRLFNPGKPMGTIGTKGSLGYLLGLYSKDGMKELETFGQIRNRFAHFHKPLDFTDQNIRSWVKSINVRQRVFKDENQPKETWDRNGLRFHFIVSLEIFSSILHQLADGYQGQTPL
jgi:DNA-binding MltR family transcriptional regulator